MTTDAPLSPFFQAPYTAELRLFQPPVLYVEQKDPELLPDGTRQIFPVYVCMYCMAWSTYLTSMFPSFLFTVCTGRRITVAGV